MKTKVITSIVIIIALAIFGVVGFFLVNEVSQSNTSKHFNEAVVKWNRLNVDLGKIQLGKVDAKSELSDDTVEEFDAFDESFHVVGKSILLKIDGEAKNLYDLADEQVTNLKENIEPLREAANIVNPVIVEITNITRPSEAEDYVPYAEKVNTLIDSLKPEYDDNIAIIDAYKAYADVYQRMGVAVENGDEIVSEKPISKEKDTEKVTAEKTDDEKVLDNLMIAGMKLQDSKIAWVKLFANFTNNAALSDSMNNLADYINSK